MNTIKKRRIKVIIFYVLFISGLVLFFYSKAMGGTSRTSRKVFSEKMFSVIAGLHPTENIIFSPASIETSLALLSLGADGATAEEIRKAIHLRKEETVSEKYAAFLKTFNSPNANDGPILKMVQRLFVHNDIQINENFHDIAFHSFETEAEHINFDETHTAESYINHWVEDQTNKKIQNLMPAGSLDEDTSAVLVNVIYFKGKWKEPFSRSYTQKMPFHYKEGDEVEVDMMYQDNKFKYVDLVEYNASALELPYEKSNISMLIILPSEINGLRKLEADLKGVDLNNIMARMKIEDVEVFLPIFRIEMDLNLSLPLMELGVTKIFSNDANLSRMFDDTLPHSITEIVHKAYLEVNEGGSEAAAATFYKIVLMSLTFNQKTFRANHPFLFYIRSDNVTYFAGRVTTF